MKVLAVSYGQTPESVADFAAYADDKAADIELVKVDYPALV